MDSSNVVEDAPEERTAQQSTDLVVGRAESGDLSSILTDDYLLPRILGELVEDGLHECRRVCKKWRDVCSTLPVKLHVSTKTSIQEPFTLFANATELTISGCLEDCQFASNMEQSAPMEGLFTAAGQFANLKRLTIRTISTTNWGMLPAKEDSLLPLVHLKALCIDDPCSIGEASLLNAIRVLTNLTSLELSPSFIHMQLRVEPITEVWKLEHLDLPVEILAEGEDKLLFPCISHLTHLKLHNVDSPAILMKVSEVCGTSLRSLALRWGESVGSPGEWSCLLHFSNLEALDFSHSFCLPSTLENVICRMIRLRNLTTYICGDGRREKMRNMLSSMHSLRSLSCFVTTPFGRSALHDQILDIAHLAPLTRLTIVNCYGEIPHHNLTGLVELCFHAGTEIDLSNSISHLLLLKKLVLINEEGPCIEHISVLRKLRRLKSVELDTQNDVSGDFFPTLASLPDLTHLTFRFRENEANMASLVKVSSVTGLRELVICNRSIDPLRFLLPGSLPILRTLRLA